MLIAINGLPVLRRVVLAAVSTAALAAMPMAAAGATPDPGQPAPTPADSLSRVDPAEAVELPDPTTDVGRGEVSAAESASDEAIDLLEDAPADTQVVCVSEDGPEVCIRRRVTDDPALPPVTAEPLVSAALGTQTLDHPGQVCDGTGSDGFRVQVVYAHTTAGADPAQVARISASLANVDAAFTGSAARTGGQRQVRWATDHGSSGCRATVRTAQITSGATDFAALLTDLENQGAVPGIGVGTTKHLVFTEGQVETPATSTCGVGESYGDDRPLDLDAPNTNLAGTRAAMDERCWDINGGGSVPAHELMHTLGAVQSSAPHAWNSGHCNDEFDLMCYGAGMTYPCSTPSDDALFDCRNDDYFNTDPIAGQYLCDHWNTSDSLYLEGWWRAQAPRAVKGLSATASQGLVTVVHGGTASCYGADYYRVSVAGVGTVDTAGTVAQFNVPPGTHTVTVWPHSPYGPVFGTPASTTVAVGNALPVGRMVLSLTDGRGYGMLAWAIDPETGGPVRMRVTIPGVVSREYDWNYVWADMPRFTGVNRTESLVFVAQLPPGSHDVCFDALDPQGGGWTRLDCRNHVVK